MGFRNGAFARVWSVNSGTNSSKVNLTVSRKDKTSDAYEVVFKDGFVSFVGDAHKKIQGVEVGSGGLSVKLLSCDVENRYDAAKKVTYTNYAVFDFEFPDGTSGGSNAKSNAKPAKQPANKEPEAAADDDELPF